MTNKRCSLNRFTFAVVAQMARALDCRSRRCRFKSDPQRHLRSFWIRWAKRSCHLAFNQVIASSNLVRITIFPLGVAQSGQSTRFGTGKSSVRIGPPRPNSVVMAWLKSDRLSADRHRFDLKCPHLITILETRKAGVLIRFEPGDVLTDVGVRPSQSPPDVQWWA